MWNLTAEKLKYLFKVLLPRTTSHLKKPFSLSIFKKKQNHHLLQNIDLMLPDIHIYVEVCLKKYYMFFVFFLIRHSLSRLLYLVSINMQKKNCLERALIYKCITPIISRHQWVSSSCLPYQRSVVWTPVLDHRDLGLRTSAVVDPDIIRHRYYMLTLFQDVFWYSLPRILREVLPATQW